MLSFEWDDDKDEVNLRKHAVSFSEAKTCFFDPKQIAFYDPDHSEDEDREILIGHSNQGRLLLVSYTLRANIIRLISSRKATKREVTRYAKGL